MFGGTDFLSTEKFRKQKFVTRCILFFKSIEYTENSHD